MKRRLEDIADHCVTVMSSPLTWLFIVLHIMVLFSFIIFAIRNLGLWKHMVTLPEPERCALCTDKGIVRTYPCLVKLETGQIGQIRVYDIGSEYLEEINQFQETGVYTYGFFVTDRFAENTTTAESSTTSLTLPENPLYINPYLYCHDCRAKIGDVIEEERIYLEGYILVDLYDLENIQTYAITDGAEYNIRGYIVEVSEEKKQLTIAVTEDFE